MKRQPIVNSGRQIIPIDSLGPVLMKLKKMGVIQPGQEGLVRIDRERGGLSILREGGFSR